MLKASALRLAGYLFNDLDLRSDFVPRGFNVNLKLFLNTYFVLNHSFCIKIL